MTTPFVKVDLFKVFGSNIDKLWSLYSMYTRPRFAENYTKEEYYRMVAEGRFSYGAAVVYLDSKPVCFCGLDEHHDWAVITRLVMLDHPTVPFATAYLVPKVLTRLQVEDKSGLIATFNEKNRTLVSTLSSAYREPKWAKKSSETYQGLPVHQLALETSQRFQFLPEPVVYNYVRQHIAYVPLKQIAPSFIEVQDENT